MKRSTQQLIDRFELAQIRNAIIHGQITPHISKLLDKHFARYCEASRFRLPKSQRTIR